MKIQEENNKEFHYTYSAKEQEELRKIREKYQSKEESEMEKLRRLDANVNKKATIVSLMYGISGALIMGIGMSIIMTDIGEHLGLGANILMILGIIIGIIGIVLVSMAYPIYNKTLKKERNKIAPEILRMTEELMK